MNTRYINYFLTGFVIVVCLIFSYFLLFSEEFSAQFPRTKRNILVGIMLSYSVFRAWRLWSMIKQDKRTKEYED